MPQTRRRDRLKDEQKREAPVATVEDAQPQPEEPAVPKVSAILVAHNQAAALRRAIEALERSKDRERLEILVVDCGSSDASATLDAEYEDITMLRLPHHFGATKAMNIATRTAKAEILFYVSPNVEVAADNVSRLAEQIAEEGETVAVCPMLFDPAGRPVSTLREMPSRRDVLREPAGAAIDLNAESVAIENPGMDALMIRKSFVKGMNYFDERFGNFGAHLDLAMQIGNAQRKVRLFPSIRATYYDASDAMSGDSLFEADRSLGAAAYLGKYDGFMSGLMFRIGAIFRALGRFRFGELSALVSGQKLDGSQAG
jgi:glycosyltransferase involved in cell wall biosynthesis